MYLKIENLNKKHSKFLYRLRNDEESRSISINKSIISYDDHKIWLNSILKNSNSSIFIFLNKKNSKIGYVRLEIFKKKTFVSIALIKEYRNKGISKIMLTKVEDLTKVKCFYASVNKKNFISIALFKSLNYYKYKTTKQFIIMKKNSNKYLDTINKIEKVRSKNNVNWMDILRLAFKLDPESAKKIMKKINHDDKRISNLLKKLS
jgi:RimJ/RimL family protein N-acetyltransferase